MFPTITAWIYGPKTGSKIYSLVFSGFAISTIIGVILSKVIIPMRADMGAEAYSPIFYALGGLSIIALILCFLFKDVP